MCSSLVSLYVSSAAAAAAAAAVCVCLPAQLVACTGRQHAYMDTPVSPTDRFRSPVQGTNVEHESAPSSLPAEWNQESSECHCHCLIFVSDSFSGWACVCFLCTCVFTGCTRIASWLLVFLPAVLAVSVAGSDYDAAWRRSDLQREDHPCSHSSKPRAPRAV
jgi:hypothetical protein